MKIFNFILVLLVMANISCKKEEKTENEVKTEKTQVSQESIVETKTVVEIDSSKENLIIYYPKFSEIDLQVGKMPSKDDKNVILCAEAAFTGELKLTFDHFNIAGDHVCGGKFYKGYRCNRNTGAFIADDKGWHFRYSTHTMDHTPHLKAKGVKVGFVQEMLIHDGKIVKHTRPDKDENEFRALCDINGKLCIADGKGKMKFGEFIEALHKSGAKEALYLDMGYGWNHSWYRDDKGNAIDIHPYGHPYCTNWIAFFE